MKFLIRVDDFGWTPQESDKPPLKLPDASLALARQFHDAMSGVPYVAAVIPAALNTTGVDWLLSKPSGLTIALHGWNHELVGDERDEMFGRSLEAIRDRICRGRKRIGPTKFYVPPFNAIAPFLAEGAWHEGIRYIFSGPVSWHTPPSPFQMFRCWIIPAWACLYGATEWRQSKDGAGPVTETVVQRCGQPGIAVLTLHLTWQADRDPEFKSVRRFARVIAAHAITADEFVREIR